MPCLTDHTIFASSASALTDPTRCHAFYLASLHAAPPDCFLLNPHTQNAAKDPNAINAILEAAKERSFLSNFTPGAKRVLCAWRRCVHQGTCPHKAH